MYEIFGGKFAGCSSSGWTDRRASGGDFRARSGSCGICFAEIEQATCRATSQNGGRIAPNAGHALGHETNVREAAGQFAQAAAERDEWPCQLAACLVHLLRELEYTEKYKSPGEHWPEFAKKLRRLLDDAIRLWCRRDELPASTYASRRDRLAARLTELIDAPWDDAHAGRLVKRLRRHQNDLFTFLHQANVPFDNNAAQRAIRPAVIIRKNSYDNRSAQGADCQAVLMSVFRTLKQRGHDPIRTIVNALENYLTSGSLPPLPKPKITSDG